MSLGALVLRVVKMNFHGKTFVGVVVVFRFVLFLRKQKEKSCVFLGSHFGDPKYYKCPSELEDSECLQWDFEYICSI